MKAKVNVQDIRKINVNVELTPNEVMRIKHALEDFLKHHSYVSDLANEFESLWNKILDESQVFK